MRKLLSLLLTVVLCLSLTACGNDTDDAQRIKKYKERIEELEDLLAERDAEIDRLLAKYEGGSANTTTKPVDPDFEMVEITLDNWQDYFEMREYHKFEQNGFGEYAGVTTYFSLVNKDGLVLDISQCNVTFEFTAYIEVKPYTVDVENQTVLYGDTTDTRIVGPTVETMNNVGQYIGEYTSDRYGEYLCVCNFIHDLKGVRADKVVRLDVSRIAGTLCVGK